MPKEAADACVVDRRAEENGGPCLWPGKSSFLALNASLAYAVWIGPLSLLDKAQMSLLCRLARPMSP